MQTAFQQGKQTEILKSDTSRLNSITLYTICLTFARFQIYKRCHRETLPRPIPFQVRREILRLIMIYKFVNNLVEIDTGNSLIKNNLPTQGHSNRFKQPFTRVNSFKHSFYPDAIKLWNKLPDTIINCTTLQNFKDLINC